jgi:putative Holliday junction resolvase
MRSASSKRFTLFRSAKLYHWGMRVLGIDVGRRRIGFAISDPSRTLARPLSTVTVAGASDAIERAAETVARLQAEDDGLDEIVVGMPCRLDGTPTTATPRVIAFIDALKKRTTLPVTTEGERLTSREAESRLAVRERDWRERKKHLDAAAAAIILQDYLDRRT